MLTESLAHRCGSVAFAYQPTTAPSLLCRHRSCEMSSSSRSGRSGRRAGGKSYSLRMMAEIVTKSGAKMVPYDELTSQITARRAVADQPDAESRPEAIAQIAAHNDAERGLALAEVRTQLVAMGYEGPFDVQYNKYGITWSQRKISDGTIESSRMQMGLLSPPGWSPASATATSMNA